jgi:hypothetical protein
MFQKKGLVVYACMLLAIAGSAQRPDTLPAAIDRDLAVDTSLDYDDVLSDLDSFLDSLLAPRSYFLMNASAGNGYFNYKNNGNTGLETKKKLVFSPALGYYHKTGPGITVSGNIIDDGRKYNLYQYAISPSFDFIRSRRWVANISYTRYIIKNELPFYITPLENEVNAWFLWRKAWLQPGLSANYGWGSRSDLEKRERYIELFNIRRGGTIVTTSSIADFSATASLRHTFYWLALLKYNDYLRFTPLLAFSAGTQKFGFNQTTGIHTINSRNSDNSKYNTGNVNLDDRLKFQPLSATLYLRPEYATGKFFIQPQLILDYYFPGTSKNLTVLFSLNAGLMF